MERKGPSAPSPFKVCYLSFPEGPGDGSGDLGASGPRGFLPFSGGCKDAPAAEAERRSAAAGAAAAAGGGGGAMQGPGHDDASSPHPMVSRTLACAQACSCRFLGNLSAEQGLAPWGRGTLDRECPEDIPGSPP